MVISFGGFSTPGTYKMANGTFGRSSFMSSFVLMVLASLPGRQGVIIISESIFDVDMTNAYIRMQYTGGAHVYPITLSFSPASE